MFANVQQSRNCASLICDYRSGYSDDRYFAFSVIKADPH